MENGKRKIGRPKAASRTGPLVLGEDRGRTKVTVEMTAATARELEDYASWVEQCAGMTWAHAAFTAVEYALRDVFRRDRLWQEHRRAGARQEATTAPPTPTPTRPSSPPPTPSPSLPPPTGTVARPAKDTGI